MTNNRWTAHDLHVELATYYYQYRNTEAPRNTFTENLWNKILETEAAEAKTRSAKRS